MTAISCSSELPQLAVGLLTPSVAQPPVESTHQTPTLMVLLVIPGKFGFRSCASVVVVVLDDGAVVVVAEPVVVVVEAAFDEHAAATSPTHRTTISWRGPRRFMRADC